MQLGYVILYVPDVRRSVDFYEKAFRLKLRFLHDSGGYAEMETGATALAFVSDIVTAGNPFDVAPARPDDPAPGIEIALVTDDVAAAYERALENGATAAMAPVAKPWGQTVSYVRDLNGYLVEICSPVAGE